jgi:hypothetical protein
MASEISSQIQSLCAQLEVLAAHLQEDSRSTVSLADLHGLLRDEVKTPADETDHITGIRG